MTLALSTAPTPTTTSKITPTSGPSLPIPAPPHPSHPILDLTRDDHNLLYSLLETHGSADGLLQILSNHDRLTLPELLLRLASPALLAALNAIAQVTLLREQIILAQCRITAIQTLDRLATRDLTDSKANPETVRKSAAQLLRTKSSPARHAEDEPPLSSLPSSSPSTANPRVSPSPTSSSPAPASPQLSPAPRPSTTPSPALPSTTPRSTARTNTSAGTSPAAPPSSPPHPSSPHPHTLRDTLPLSPNDAPEAPPCPHPQPLRPSTDTRTPPRSSPRSAPSSPD